MAADAEVLPACASPCGMSAILLGVVAAALILLARVVDEARLVQAELDEIL